MKEGSPLPPPLPDLAGISGELQPQTQEVVIFDAKKENQMRHNKNLHGDHKNRVDGLTGFYHRKYYIDGRHQPRRKPK